jgi:hypothetical protein
MQVMGDSRHILKGHFWAAMDGLLLTAFLVVDVVVSLVMMSCDNFPPF